MNWTTWVLFVGLLWSYPVCVLAGGENDTVQKLQHCLKNTTQHFVIADYFNGFITADEHLDQSQGCILFLLQNNMMRPNMFGKLFPHMEEYDGSRVLRVSKEYTQFERLLYVLQGRRCNSQLFDLKDSYYNSDSMSRFQSLKGSCQITCLNIVECQQSRYDENICNQRVLQVKDEYIININSSECFTCNNPVKLPEHEVEWDPISSNEEGKLDAAEAVGVMKRMADLAASINGSSAVLTMGERVSGILVTQTDPEDEHEISIGYGSQNDSIYIIEGKYIPTQFSRYVTLSKEAFEKSVSLNVIVPFVAVLRFINLTSDEKNSTLLGDEVFAVEMGTTITNLVDKISINYKNVKYKGTPSCHSWNGVGSRPKWTDDGCLTKINEDTVTCECSHLTFFAFLLAPPIQTLPAFDLNSLTIITQVGCALSMFFLSMVLFMHFLWRRTNASTATMFLIQLVSAMFLLNLTFLINNFVAKLKSSLCCRIVAALMHYFMLTTLTWFAVQAFHLGLNLYRGGQIVIRHYLLKVSITSWVLPSVVGTVLLILGKYGEQVISTSDTENNVAVCWITDNAVHYIVNMGYYGVVFLFTFTTFIIILSRLFCPKGACCETSRAEMCTNRKGIAIILGLCCMMGITWGFAFFAYGILRIPAYYIFTVLNSFQGFFLFIYYYCTSHSGKMLSGQEVSASTSTVESDLDENPYVNLKRQRRSKTYGE